MARIDLKNATIRLVDGYSNTAAIDDTPVNGDTNLDIDTVDEAGIIPPGTRFTIVGSTDTYYVTGYNANDFQEVTVDAASGNFTLGFTGTVANPISVQTTANIAYDATAATVATAIRNLAAISNTVDEDVSVTGPAGGPWVIEFKGAWGDVALNELVTTDVDLTGGGDSIDVTAHGIGGTPHNITFTPALATVNGIPADDAVITFEAHTLEVNVGDGNLTYSEAREMLYELNRGVLDTVREGDQQPVEVSMDFVWEFLTSGNGEVIPTIEDALKNRGAASTWVSSSDDPCEPYAVDIEVEYVPPCSDAEREIITLSDFRWETLDHNFTDAQVSATGKCNVVEAAVARVE